MPFARKINFKYYIMIQIKKQQLEGVVYSAPSILALDVEIEGVLCASGDYTIGGAGKYDDADINDNGSY